MTLELHPMTELLPPMTDEEYVALKASISEKGLLVPLTTLRYYNDGKPHGYVGPVIDGRHRLRACLELRVVTPIKEQFFWSEEEAVRWVLDVNIHRRNLTPGQKAMAATKCLEYLEQEAKKRQGARTDISANLRESEKGKSSEKAAEIYGVSPRMVESAKTIRKQGTPDLATAAETGKLPIHVAEKVARMPEEKQQTFVERVKAAPEKPAHQHLAAINRDEKREQIIQKAKHAPLPTDRTFPVVYADPPWRFEKQTMGHTDRSAENHYPTMSLEEIKRLPVAKLAGQNAVLFLWVTVPQIEAGLEVMNAWGFDYKSHFVWIKNRIGTGYHTRNQHELLFIGRRGDIPLQEPSDTLSSVVEAPCGRHSEKPAAFYEIIERMYPGYPKIELFSRGCREGWEAWGLEAKEPTEIDKAFAAFFQEDEPELDEATCERCGEDIPMDLLGFPVIREQSNWKLLESGLLVMEVEGKTSYCCSRCVPGLVAERESEPQPDDDVDTSEQPVETLPENRPVGEETAALCQSCGVEPVGEGQRYCVDCEPPAVPLTVTSAPKTCSHPSWEPGYLQCADGSK